MSDVVVRAEGLGKKYVIGHQAAERVPTLRDTIARTARKVARTAGDMIHGRPLVTGDEVEEFWALKNVSFEIRRGDVVGIIGRNGAGKSTLLKILSRITEPSAGRVEIRGRVASLLEVGTGFHPELTGRENIYLNGAVLGMTRVEIQEKFDEIVDFAGVERFLDTPVKRYSSGMYVRLAFAIAAHLDPEILVVDEVLAVGDAEFQKRCLGKMSAVAKGGRTVLFVSHNMAAVASLCSRALLLTYGQIKEDDDALNVVDKYFEDQQTSNNYCSPYSSCPTKVRLSAAGINILTASAQGTSSRRYGIASSSEAIEVACIYSQLRVLPRCRVVLQVVTSTGVLAFASTDHEARSYCNFDAGEPGTYRTSCIIPAGLLNVGKYIIRLRFGVPGGELLIPDTDVLQLFVRGPYNHGSRYDVDWPGAVCPRLEWKINTLSENSLDTHFMDQPEV